MPYLSPLNLINPCISIIDNLTPSSELDISNSRESSSIPSGSRSNKSRTLDFLYARKTNFSNRRRGRAPQLAGEG